MGNGFCRAQPVARLVGRGCFVGLSFVAFGIASGQSLYSIGNPTNEQQYMLELVNRARANGSAEAARLGLSGLQEGPPTINGEAWTIANMVQPLSWNPLLAEAAQNHADALNAADQFFLGGSPHTFGGETPTERIADTGYNEAVYNGPTTASGYYPGPENIAEEESQGSNYIGANLTAAILRQHDLLFTDQDTPGRGHRQTLMLGFFRELGVGISVGTDNETHPGQPDGTFDSLYVVQDYGTRAGGSPLITGVVYHDANGNGIYDPGEGISGVHVTVPGSNYFAVTSPSGGYSIPVPGNGGYNVSFNGPVDSHTEAVTVSGSNNAKADYLSPTAAPTLLANISTRLNVETGDNVLIGGFIITGTGTKQILLRAIGPSLSVSDKLANPVLKLYDKAGALLASNDDWVTSPQKEAIINSGIPPTNDKESAIIRTVPTGDYTAIVSGAGGTSGVALVEIYDLTPSLDSKLANISTRGDVQTGDNVMIGGTIITGAAPQKVLVRALGPSLAISNHLANPFLTLRDGNGNLVRANDNWKDTQEAAIEATKTQPTNDLESAIVATLPPGPYTAIVSGVDHGTGVALVEFYALAN
jgi:hypothetical protein